MQDEQKQESLSSSDEDASPDCFADNDGSGKRDGHGWVIHSGRVSQKIPEVKQYNILSHTIQYSPIRLMDYRIMIQFAYLINI